MFLQQRIYRRKLRNADQYGLEPEKIAQYYENDPGFIQEVAIQKALELVCSTAVVKAAKAE